MNMIPSIIPQALAHDQIYPHIHPHAQSSATMDIVLSLVWIAALVFVALLLVKVTRHIIQSQPRKPDITHRSDTPSE